MRDIAVTLLIFGFVPIILRYPWIGVLVFVWLSLFNPHKFAWGFAQDFPFVMVIAATTVVSMAFHIKRVNFPLDSITVHLVLLLVWILVTTLFAFDPAAAYPRWLEVSKALFFVLVAASLVHTKKQVEALLWVLVLSLAYYGIKGGIFTLVVGGSEKVYGPPGSSYLTDNNAIAVALVMVIPLMYHLASMSSSRWIRYGMYGGVCLTGIAVLGSQSRGAFIAVLAMLAFFWLKNRRKLILGAVLLLMLPLAIGVMSERWENRIKTIETYEQDSSANMRLNAWGTAWNIARDRPIVGGGFELATKEVYERYAPDPGFPPQVAHSIYFQMLGEHGFVGLFLFLSLGAATWRLARRIIRDSRGKPEDAWRDNLARAIQVSLVGFAVGGAFVSIAYWEVQYYEMVILAAAYRLSRASESEPKLGFGEKRRLTSRVAMQRQS
ncbi:MAG: putative O-glycosylation ligase, exosortase A system-associated [Rhodospirillaceae bacterium]